MAYLSDGLQEWLGLDVSCGSSDFSYYNICTAGFAAGIDEVLYFIRDMRNDLDSASKIFAVSFLLQYVPIHFTAGKVGELG